MEPVDVRERVVPAEAELTRVPASEYRCTSRCDAGVTRLLGQRQRAFGNWNARQLFRQEQPANHSSERHKSRKNVPTSALSGPISKTKPTSLLPLIRS